MHVSGADPNLDFGYDVSDITFVAPELGTSRSLTPGPGLRARGIRLVLDFVPNHTSDQHPWFLESRSSRASEKGNRYIWRAA